MKHNNKFLRSTLTSATVAIVDATAKTYEVVDVIAGTVTPHLTYKATIVWPHLFLDFKDGKRTPIKLKINGPAIERESQRFKVCLRRADVEHWAKASAKKK